jgi:small nuclear ribonucleoprotein (snRNP)-like protein
MSEVPKKITMFRAYLHQSLDKEVEVITARGEPIYGKLVGYSLDSNPPVIIIENMRERYFINLRHVESIRSTVQ